MYEVDYSVSLHPAKSEGYQSKAGTKGKITLYAVNLWKNADGDFEDFLERLTYVALLERICIERAWQGIRMTNRCQPHCKLQKIADLMLYPDSWHGVRAHYRELHSRESEAVPSIA